MQETNPILFRCHNAHDLLTEPKSKADKEAGLMAETSKTMIRKMWLKNNYGYKEPLVTEAVLKGLLCEQDGMGLAQEVVGGEFRRRYGINLCNNYITGTPDIVLKNEDYVEDIKISENLATFFDAELTPRYETQGQCYMWLTGKKKYRLIYCLVPSPPEFVIDAQRRMFFKFGCDESNADYIEAYNQIEHNNNLILSMPAKDRVKVFEFGYNESTIERLKIQIEKARNYYQTLKIT